MTKINWDRAKKSDTSEPGYKQQRLDRAADNWLDHGSLNRKPPVKPTKAKRKPPSSNT
jgi:hypothetical protein